jgi:ssDNA-binding Zn-finger/Zn-ribbon topoisomerase 1
MWRVECYVTTPSARAGSFSVHPIYDVSQENPVMAQAEETPITRRCPRCGGLMKKLPGSSLYWHADNNHPRCDITNIVDTSINVQTSDEPREQTDQPPKGKNRKK